LLLFLINNYPIMTNTLKKTLSRFSFALRASVIVATLATALPGHATDVAPYFYTWGFGNSTYKVTSLVDARNKTGITAATLAFGVSTGSCALTGGLEQTTANSTFYSDVRQFIRGGGKVVLSFGGASGSYLESVCTSTQLTTLISSLMDTLGTYSLDFDIEGSQIASSSLNSVRNATLVALQAKYPSLEVTLTLPVMPTGLTADGVTVVKSAATAGVKLRAVNLMTMDYGIGTAQTMGDKAIAALTATETQLKAIYPSYTDATLWSMLGATPMIGQNDVSGEVFTQTDATNLVAFAKQKSLRLLSYWAIQRDQLGSGSLALYSGTNIADYEFTKIFLQAGTASGTSFSSSSSSAAASSSSSSKASSSSSSVAASSSSSSKASSSSSSSKASSSSSAATACAAWAEGKSYTVGQVVTYNGLTYTALQSYTAWAGAGWNPAATPALWVVGGSCK
jgi:hypothetical protein